MILGAFSISLAVKDIRASRDFYAKLGFEEAGGDIESFTDVRELQRALRADGIEMVVEADESGPGPASFCILDPDGNPILVDQHR
jgi:hypothetical protein